MNKVHFITYATHESGTFIKLINNKFQIKINVLGFGTKWNGFMDKINGVLDFTKKVNDNEIIIFLDGFDTIINKNVNKLLETFLKFNCSILVSKHPSNTYIEKKIFGHYDIIANSGMYIGYANKIKLLCEKMIKLNMKDDQRALNYCIYNYKELNAKIDINNIIFTNHPIVSGIFNNKLYNSYFVSYPGGSQLSINYKIDRYLRSIHNYMYFLIYEIILILIIIFLIYKYYNYEK